LAICAYERVLACRAALRYSPGYATPLVGVQAGFVINATTLLNSVLGCSCIVEEMSILIINLLFLLVNCDVHSWLVCTVQAACIAAVCIGQLKHWNCKPQLAVSTYTDTNYQQKTQKVGCIRLKG
jgi:hypothetical protein